MSSEEQYLQPIMEALAEALPRVTIGVKRTTTPGMKKGSRISGHYLDEWQDFKTDVTEFINKAKGIKRQSAGQSGAGPSADPPNPKLAETKISRVGNSHPYIIGQEDGLKSKVIELPAEPMNRIVEQAFTGRTSRIRRPFPGNIDLEGVRFADPKCVQAVFGKEPRDAPDMVILRTGKNEPPALIAPIEIKTFWTLDLDYLNIRKVEKRKILGYWLGQLVHYMNTSQSQYGALTTLEETVFLKRMSVTSIHVTVPITSGDTGPSLREAMFYFMDLLTHDSPEPDKKSSKKSSKKHPSNVLFGNPLSEGNPSRASRQRVE
ncbi:hypothetical protein TWF506_007503 [Arthrobotrys conoides]|uniref:Uncharacterized protein n=1 Tax=Arthrobotrys conoides TaxID=74498 RepID=A0AAN8RSV8_9PEZI